MAIRKFLAVCIIGLSLGAASVYADHPSGWGVGIFGRGGWGWGGGAGGNFGLTLKIPSIPVFWGLTLGIGGNYFGAGLTGDYYFIDKPLVPDVKLHWYLGLGGYFDFQHWSYDYGWYDYSYSNFGFGVRVPIGLSWQPLDFLEVFLAFVPNLGLGFDTDGESNGQVYHDGGVYFGFGFGAELGLRFWF